MIEAGNIVIDLPEGTPTEEASRALNAPGDGYFLVQVLPVLGGHRAYLRRYKQTATKTEAVTATVESVDNATALSIVRANRTKTLRDIVSLLAKAGIKRGRQWVNDTLDATCAEDGREEEAVRYVATLCGPTYTPKDVLEELRYYKIRRSVAWARRKLDEKRALSAADKS